MKILKFNENYSSKKEKLKQDLYNIFNLKLGSTKNPSDLRYEMMQVVINNINKISGCNVRVKDPRFEFEIENNDMTVEDFDQLCDQTIDFGELV